MNKYIHNKTIQRVCCHTMSNIAIHQDYCQLIIDYNLHDLILTSLEKNNNDWKLCWLACSAIWNIARPVETRSLINPKVISLIFDILEKYKDTILVCETGLGALSNLMLYEDFKNRIRNKHLKFIVKLLVKFPTKISDNDALCKLLTAGNGLITNLAHNDDLAIKLNKLDIVNHLINTLNFFIDEEHLIRNTCAALTNLSNIENYDEDLLKYNGIETLIKIYYKYNNIIQVQQLSIQALKDLVDINSIKNTTSLHISVKLELYDIVKYHISNGMDINVDEELITYNDNDFKIRTPLLYAILNNDYGMIRFLISRKANYEYYENLLNDEHREAIKKGNQDLKEKHITRSKTISESSNIIFDVSMIISSYEVPDDMFKYY